MELLCHKKKIIVQAVLSKFWQSKMAVNLNVWFRLSVIWISKLLECSADEHCVTFSWRARHESPTNGLPRKPRQPHPQQEATGSGYSTFTSFITCKLMTVLSWSQSEMKSAMKKTDSRLTEKMTRCLDLFTHLSALSYYGDDVIGPIPVKTKIISDIAMSSAYIWAS